MGSKLYILADICTKGALWSLYSTVSVIVILESGFSIIVFINTFNIFHNEVYILPSKVFWAMGKIVSRLVFSFRAVLWGIPWWSVAETPRSQCSGSGFSLWPGNKIAHTPETPVLWPPHAKSWLIGKDSDAGRDWGQEEKGTTEDEMAGWHHWLDGRESEWTPGVGEGQGGLACCDSWGLKESDTTEWMIWSDLIWPQDPAWCNKDPTCCS